MASIRRAGEAIDVELEPMDCEVLTQIIDELSPALGTAPLTALRAYDDARLEAEYARWTRPGVEDGRSADVAAVREALVASAAVCHLDEAEALRWVRVLNHLRLAAGDKLGIDADDWEQRAPDSLFGQREYAMLEVLGWLQEGIVVALEGAADR